MRADSAHHAQSFGGVEDDLDAPPSGFFTSSFVSGYNTAPIWSFDSPEHRNSSLLHAALAVVATCIGIIAAVGVCRQRQSMTATKSAAELNGCKSLAHAMPAAAAQSMTLRCLYEFAVCFADCACRALAEFHDMKTARHASRSGVPRRRHTPSGGAPGDAAAVAQQLLPSPEERLKLLTLDDGRGGGGGGVSTSADWGIGSACRSASVLAKAGLRLGLPPEEASVLPCLLQHGCDLPLYTDVCSCNSSVELT